MASFTGYDNTANTPPRDRSFELLPPSKFSAMVTNTELKDSRTPGGKILKVEYLITGPTHAGRKIFQNINVRNPNAQAEQIGQQELGDLKAAVGLTGVMTDTTQLHNIPLTIKLKVREGRLKNPNNPAEGSYDAENVVSYVKALEGQAPAASGFTPPSSVAQPTQVAGQPGNFPTAASPTTGRPPWATSQAGAQ